MIKLLKLQFFLHGFKLRSACRRYARQLLATDISLYIGIGLGIAMNSNYDTDNFNPIHLNSKVVTIHICGYKNELNEGDEDGNPPTNHWAVFLQLAAGGSVRLDMTPGYGSDGLRGKIEVASKNYKSTQNSIKTLSFQVQVHTTVDTIAQLITSKGRDKYKFTEEEEGCRYWVSTFISDLEAAGIIDAGSGQSALGAVSYYWRNPSGFEPRIVKRGTF